ncbi:MULTISPECIES: methylaspartate mutase [unclassified Streptomyces]|uniref:methylaspartate mutase n=1 Tax=unclassified Streptomyces TaxID=2593676 RepID=UPI00099F54E0|nr:MULTISPECIES: methylaspartate mutase [unclassified Streptomyces]MCP3768082.1 methylaspartate mutase [Streptomyces sp. MAR25Y5]
MSAAPSTPTGARAPSGTATAPAPAPSGTTPATPSVPSGTGPAGAPASPFGRFVAEAAAAGRLVVQPRMGFSDPGRMRRGLERTRFAAATTVGTLTLDSYTRLGDHAAVRRALDRRVPLNGYPLVDLPVERTRELLDGVRGPDFPVQVRHGSARPDAIVRAMTSAGLDATEGGPVSYCLPYGRTSLRDAVDNWARACDLLAQRVPAPGLPHVETFGGCLLGQLCPPALLVAVSVLEALFFTQHGIRSVSLSYAQQRHPGQDEEALRALRRLAADFLPAGTDRHLVLYTYMGVFPRTRSGARRLLEDSARLAVRSGAERLVVKTAAEAHRIPSVEENISALESAGTAAELATARWRGAGGPPRGASADSAVHVQARALVEAVLGLSPDVGRGLRTAFARGLLDIPYCLHPDNAGRSRSFVDASGRLRWSSVGAMPITADGPPGGHGAMTSGRLLAALNGTALRYDREST